MTKSKGTARPSDAASRRHASALRSTWAPERRHGSVTTRHHPRSQTCRDKSGKDVLTNVSWPCGSIPPFRGADVHEQCCPSPCGECRTSCCICQPHVQHRIVARPTPSRGIKAVIKVRPKRTEALCVKMSREPHQRSSRTTHSHKSETDSSQAVTGRESVKRGRGGGSSEHEG